MALYVVGEALPCRSGPACVVNSCVITPSAIAHESTTHVAAVDSIPTPSRSRCRSRPCRLGHGGRGNARRSCGICSLIAIRRSFVSFVDGPQKSRSNDSHRRVSCTIDCPCSAIKSLSRFLTWWSMRRGVRQLQSFKRQACLLCRPC